VIGLASTGSLPYEKSNYKTNVEGETANNENS